MSVILIYGGIVMKKISSYLILAIMALVAVPTLISAANMIKEVDGRVYVIEDNADISCSESEDAIALDDSYQFDNFIVFYDNDFEYYYKYNVNTGVCSLLSEVETNNMLILQRQNDKTATYELDLDDKIYKTESMKYIISYVKTTDETVDENKTYYIKVDDEIIKVDIEDYDDEDIENYLEQKYFIRNLSVDYDSEVDYYLNPTPDDEVTKVVIPDPGDWEGEYNFLDYWVIIDEEDLFTRTDVMTIDFDDFNKNPDEGITLNRTDLYNVIKLDGEIYLIFKFDDDENGLYFIYKNNGTLMKDSSNQVIVLANPVNADNMWAVYIKEYVHMVDHNFTTINIFEVSPSASIFGNRMFAKDNQSLYYYAAQGGTKYSRVTVYKLNEGANQTYNNADLTFTFNGDLNKLDQIKINGSNLGDSNYTTTSGSTIITLKNSFLKTLKAGSYILKAEYTDGGYASVTFTVGEANPKTYDGIMTYIVIGAVSLITVAGILVYNRKKIFNLI